MSILIAYYSHSGNTAQVAEMIAQETGGQLLRIEPETAYPTAYNAVVEQAKKEIKKGYQPPIRNVAVDVAGYDTVLIGTPNWWSTIAPPIATFLSQCDMAGKRIAVFCTHGGGGAGHIERDVAQLCPGAAFLPGISLYGNGGASAKKEIASWTSKLNLS